MTKKLVTRYQYIDLEDNIEQVIFNLQKAKAEGWEAVELGQGDHSWWSNSNQNWLIKQELETDQEYAKRTAEEKLRLQNQAERDARDYKRLKAQFGE